jgi:hypothetical protein
LRSLRSSNSFNRANWTDSRVRGGDRTEVGKSPQPETSLEERQVAFVL